MIICSAAPSSSSTTVTAPIRSVNSCAVWRRSSHRGRTVPARPRAPLSRSRGKDRRGQEPGRSAPRKRSRGPRGRSEDRISDRRRDHRFREPRLSAERLGSDSSPLLPPTTSPCSERLPRSRDLTASGRPYSLVAMASFTFVREVAAPPEVVFDVLTDHRRYPNSPRSEGSSWIGAVSPRRMELGQFGSCTRSGRRCARK